MCGARRKDHSMTAMKHNNERHAGSRLVMIGLAIVLMAAAVYIIGTSLVAEQESATLSHESGSDAPSLPVEEGVFKRSSQALTYLESTTIPMTEVDEPRQLATFQERRAFEGAPPVIPHAAKDDQSFGENSCLQCHDNGGYSPQFQAYAPVVPHPELISCRQCHVAPKSTELFDESDFQGNPAPAIHQAALFGAPPPIPHDLQMRENCLACHAGPAAAAEIRVSHPERVNCRQCHVQIQTGEEWSR